LTLIQNMLKQIAHNSCANKLLEKCLNVAILSLYIETRGQK